MLNDIDGIVLLVLDGCSIHKANCVQTFVDAQRGRLKRFFMPPYSPHLSPDEQVWGNVKAWVDKQTVTTKIALRDQLAAALERLKTLPQLVAGFFHHPHCQYILGAMGLS